MKKLLKKCRKGILGSLMILALFAPMFAKADLSPVLDRDNLFGVKNTLNTGYVGTASAQPGERLAFRVHVHNNILNTTANDVRVRVDLPTGVRTSGSATAYVSASNAAGINSTVNLSFSEPMTLSYVPGSTRLIDHNYNTSTLPDGVATNGVGVNLGNVQGCWEYERWVIFEAIVTAVPTQEARLQIVKFNDANGNRTQESGEPFLAGWQFRISGPNGYSNTVTTDNAGQVTVTGLPVGRYTVTEITQSGWINTTGLSRTEDIAGGETQRFVFGNQRINPDVPVPPTVGGGDLPSSGPGDVAGAMAASMTISGGALAWIRSRKKLLEAFRK